MSLPFIADPMPRKLLDLALDMLVVKKTHGRFADRYVNVPVFEVTGKRSNFCAFVYMCRLNLDLDGAANSYGYDNPAKGSIQTNLAPLETWSPPNAGKLSHAYREKVGLGNACGDPGDGTKGWKNFLAGNRNFYWAGIKALTKVQARTLNLTIDDRAELEAGLETYAKDKKPVLKPVGSGWFPVVNRTTGYYISGTSVAADGSASAFSAEHYLDSSVVPYAVWANNWLDISLVGRKLHQGDFGLAINNNTGSSTGYVYGDSGTANKVGESSQALHNALGAAGLVTFIAFPGSGSGKVVNNRYIPDPLGKQPALRIGVEVLKQMFRLQSSASSLAYYLSLGSELGAPTSHTSQKGSAAEAEQARLYKNFMAALSGWTLAS